jgi:hypothetical protein
MTPFLILLRAHDAVWADRSVNLRERKAACQMLWDALIHQETR